nr:MAG TPA: hypothetical protein [Caudoviricetes sp.]
MTWKSQVVFSQCVPFYVNFVNLIITRNGRVCKFRQSRFISWRKKKNQNENLYHGDIFPANPISAFTYSSHNSQHTPTYHRAIVL